MPINAITNNFAPNAIEQPIKPNLHNTTPYKAQESFATELKQAIAEVNNQQIQSDNLTQKLINGENVELHQVMIASQKAGVTLSATMEVRNKVIDAYQEIMRMSV
ncbi:flagellar hook-basal body complex protein FliE [Lysinibacillus alkalisoli]|uniref:Flagellar hook-basal body complex protein FliE n=1 Tax=Lysinibacillus alkalisoli TaxID=1911548 RepID=A0A917G408_9BACI|nr:flagellar hook-basal body complex protein FliE [Lysinibacillus alkalisoli]GGG21739.1 flagellar hook-basal body complex protein FliE [Lysinibacillus alkalisoli]